MTLHTKAATDDILDIFNQPLRNVGPLSNQADSAGESEFDDDDYTSAGESTGTGAISGASEFGDDIVEIKGVVDREESGSASPWSDFTASKHVPHREEDSNLGDDEKGPDTESHDFVILEDAHAPTGDSQEILVTPIDTEPLDRFERPRFVPKPPEDYEPPVGPYRDPSQVAQNRLPFMTPIVEKTESSMGALTVRDEKDYFNSKTPSKQHGDGSRTCDPEEDLLCSPFQEIVNNVRAERVREQSPVKKKVEKKKSKPATKQRSKEPVIKDTRCNPYDDSVRAAILESLDPGLSSFAGFRDHRPQACHKAPELRKFVKALAKTAKGGSDKTTTTVSIPPTLRFPDDGVRSYTIKRELGKGAFAPVYLAQMPNNDEENDEENAEQQDLSQSLASSSTPTTADQPTGLVAIKCEDPPTPWEFYIMSIAHARLGPSNRAFSSILLPYEMHLFADEGYLVEQYLDQGTLLDLVNTAKADSPSGVLDEPISMFFTVELLRTLEALHSTGILHGDLKADNCLVRLHPPTNVDGKDDWDTSYHRNGTHGWSNKGLCLIDFGRGIDMRQSGHEAQFIADWKTSKADCAEMREMRPWTYQVDYWGAAGVVHSLLFGKYIEDVAVEAAPPTKKQQSSHRSDKENSCDDDDGIEILGGDDDHTIAIKAAREKRWRIKEPLKRYWQTELWGNLFDLLLNPTRYVDVEEGGKMPVMKSLRACREAMEEWLEAESGRRGLKSGLRRLEERIREKRK
ncbi:MAG: hypothetical protein Q9220_000661 [cf. Caloplaca sp. 1 TL-2023]